MHRALAFVRPHFLESRYRVGQQQQQQRTLVADTAFFAALDEFVVVDNEVMAWLAKVVCEPEGLHAVTRTYLLAHLAQVLLWLVCIPPIWIECAGVQQLYEVMGPWFAIGKVPPEHRRQAAELVKLMAVEVNGLSPVLSETISADDLPGFLHDARAKAHAFVRPAVTALIEATTASLRARAVATAREAYQFPVYVPESMQNAVMVLLGLGVMPPGVRVPRCVTAAAPLGCDVYDVYDLIALLPAHVPGLAFERSFAGAVFGDEDRPSLHEALVFCTQDWAVEWMARGWDTSRAAQSALERLHDDEWQMTDEDALLLILG